MSLKTLFLAGASLAILATGPKLLDAPAVPTVTAAPAAVADTSPAPAHTAPAASSTAKPAHAPAPKTAAPKPPKKTAKPAPKPKPSRWVVYTVNVDYTTSDAGVYSVTCTTVDNQGAHPNPARMRDVTITRAQYDRFVDNPVTSSIPCPR